jgi:hypothetical protein
MTVVDVVAYLDDSGHEDDPNELMLAIGGGTATAGVWDEVATKWRRALGEAALGAFHANEFHRFWQHDTKRAQELIRQLVGIADTLVLPVIAYAGVEGYRAALKPMPDEPQQRRAHDFAVEYCFNRVLERSQPADQIRVVFSKTPKYVGRVAEIHARFKRRHPLGSRLGEITLDHTPEDDIHLQVADLLVSGFTRGAKRNEVVLEWTDWLLANIIVRYPGEWRRFTFEELVEWKPMFEPDS